MNGFYDIAKRIVDVGLSHYLEEYNVFIDDADNHIYSFAKMRRNITLLKKESCLNDEAIYLLSIADNAVRTAYEMAKLLPLEPTNEELADYQEIRQKIFLYYTTLDKALNLINNDKDR